MSHEQARPLLRDVEAASIASSSSHGEPHFGSLEIIRDVIVGLSDGLTVPFALAAVVTAGVAEIIAGSISMGLGGYLAGKTEIEHFDSERKRELKEVHEVPHREEREMYEIFEPYGISRAEAKPVVDALMKNEDMWVDFMMKFELGLERPDPRRSWISATTIGVSYMIGGFVPLAPYFFINSATEALKVSVGVTLLALLVFGYVKAVLLGNTSKISNSIQTMFIGAMAAGAAFWAATLLSQ